MNLRKELAATDKHRVSNEYFNLTRIDEGMVGIEIKLKEISGNKIKKNPIIGLSREDATNLRDALDYLLHVKEEGF